MLALTTSQDVWQLQTAKAQFSELFRRARTEGPQLVTRHGKEAVVVVAAEEYEALVARPGQQNNQQSLVEFLRNSPLAGADLDLERDRDTGRDIAF